MPQATSWPNITVIMLGPSRTVACLTVSCSHWLMDVSPPGLTGCQCSNTGSRPSPHTAERARGQSPSR